MTPTAQFRLLTVHYGLYQLAMALAGGFAGAYLLQLGVSLPAALAGYAASFAIRFMLRFVALGAAQRVGLQATLIAGVIVNAAQFLPLAYAGRPVWLLVWLFMVALGDALYWPVFHAATAVTGNSVTRGRELGRRQMLGTLIAVVGPLVGGLVLARCGPAADFGVAAVLCVLSIVPAALLPLLLAGPIPSLGQSLRRMDTVSVTAFAADGWICGGLVFAWPMILFGSLGGGYAALGLANAGAGLAGAATSLLCGAGIDRGERSHWLNAVSIALLGGIALRAWATWSPAAAAIANATGAAVTGLYVPVLMSVIYERAKRSGAAYRFHFAAEAGWDAGAAGGCLAAAAVAALAPASSLAVVPAALGVAVVYACVRTASGALQVSGLAKLAPDGITRAI